MRLIACESAFQRDPLIEGKSDCDYNKDSGCTKNP